MESKCDLLEVAVVSSLLYTAGTQLDIHWKSRIRACYAIEYLMLKKEKYWKFFKTNCAYLGNIDINYMKSENAKSGQELQTVMVNIKRMVDSATFNEISNNKDDIFDPMAMQEQLPNKPKGGKAMDFLNKKKNTGEADLLDGVQPGINKVDKPEQNQDTKKKSAFNFIKKNPSTENAPKSNEAKNQSMGGFMDLDFDLTANTGNGQQTEATDDLLGEPNMNQASNNILQNNTNVPKNQNLNLNNDLFGMNDDLLNGGGTNNVNTG